MLIVYCFSISLFGALKFAAKFQVRLPYAGAMSGCLVE